MFDKKMEDRYNPIVFSEWLKRRRKALYMTQDELAQRAGCSISALRKIESGERRPSKQLAGLLAQALEVSQEDQQAFIRAARGEIHIERLKKPELDSLAPLSDVLVHPQDQQRQSASPMSRPGMPLIRLPLQATPLIGREAELVALERLFIDPQCRLLTLTGVGGIGKTRLAIEFAAKKHAQYPGGVFYIPLTAVNSPEKIIPAIADVLDFGFSGPNDPKEQLFNYILSHVSQDTLFVLDNLEHMLGQSSIPDDKSGLVELVSEMLERLPNLKIIGTSRERLNLHGEWTYELHGLSVPPTNFAGRVEDYESIGLFIRSAQRIRADFRVEPEDQLALIQICQLVDGVPLAVELAAAWVGILSCQEIALEIKSNMDFLSTSMRDLPERHRSMRATFDHSWKLLSDEERGALCQLSVFKGGFDRHAANEVAGASLPLLASLSTKSLLRRTEGGRYDLHEVIRQYALSHLHDDPHHVGTYERHCKYYLTFLQDRESALKRSTQQQALRELADVIDNIRSAWIWAINHEQFDLLRKAGRAFGWYFEIAGLYRDGIEQLELLRQALKDKPQDDAWRRLMGLTLIHQALLYFRIGEFDQTQKHYEESIAILRPIDDQILLADALAFLGTIQHLSGDFERAKSLLEEGLVYARSSNDRWFEAYAICNLGFLASLLGRSEEGYEQMMAGLAIWRTLGDPHAIALGLNFMVPVLSKLGRHEEAKTLLQESITLCEQAKNRWGMGTAYRFLGLATMAEGRFAEAEIYLNKSLEVFGESFVGWDIARTLAYLGDCTVMAGKFHEARKNYQAALRLSIESKAIPIALDALAGLCQLQARAGNDPVALDLCYWILNHTSLDAETKKRVEELRKSLETRLSSEQIRMARTTAQEKPFDAIVKEALELV